MITYKIAVLAGDGIGPEVIGENAVTAILSDPAHRTADLGGPLGTQAMTRLVIDALA